MTAEPTEMAASGLRPPMTAYECRRIPPRSGNWGKTDAPALRRSSVAINTETGTTRRSAVNVWLHSPTKGYSRSGTTEPTHNAVASNQSGRQSFSGRTGT
ncbi:MAG: hypothetical protein M5U19_15120 [Microthrixaceae bacterium]|nr:hypothetical protein [Microthrixaceae bacterium]